MRFALPALITALALVVSCSKGDDHTDTDTDTDSDADADSDTDTDSDSDTDAITTDVALRDGMRQLWTQHVAMTRVYLIEKIADMPAAPSQTDRLLQNQVHIGDAIRPFYGDDAGDALTDLLVAHILGADTLVEAAIAGDADAVGEANVAWHDNGHEIATFLAAANPAWDEGMLATHMDEHLDLTLLEASSRLGGDYAADIAAYDQVQDQILGLADLLAEGILEQHPDLVARHGMPVDDQNLHVAMRELWQDHFVWTRIYIISDVAELPDTSFAAQRLLDNQADIGAAVVPIFGPASGDALTSLLEAHILGAVAILDAAEAGDIEAQATATAAWYANAHEIADFLADANPAWTEAELNLMLEEHLDLTLAEATARLTADYDGDIVAADAIEAEMMMMSDVLTEGLVEYRNENE